MCKLVFASLIGTGGIILCGHAQEVPQSGNSAKSATLVYSKAEEVTTTPKVIFAPDPEFPDKARHKKLSGNCVLSIVVDAEGKTQNVQVVKSIADSVNPKFKSIAREMDENAVKAVQQYRFEPATKLGKPVPYKTSVEVNYRIY
jgi:TonB family protein